MLEMHVSGTAQCRSGSELRPGEVHQRDNKVLKNLRYVGGTHLL